MSDPATIPPCPNPKFAEFRVGQRIEFDACFTAADVDRFAELSGDWNPLHVNATYAARTPFRGQVVHGMLVASLLSRVAGMYFPGQQALLMQVENVAFHSPVAVAEPLHCVAELVQVHDILRILVADVQVLGRYGKLRMSARIKVQYRAPARASWALPTQEEIMETDLSNRVALVTGASRGIGAAIAEALGHCHAKVVVNYHQASDLAEEVAHRVEQAGGKAVPIRADVAKRDEVATLIKQAEAALGPIDLFVHNATGPLEDLSFAETPWELMLRDFEIHVGGAFHCLQKLLPGMMARKFGRIVTLLSVTLESPPPKGYTCYVAAKSGLMGLTRCVAAEYARFGITANMVSPSMVETDLTGHLDERAKQMTAMRTPIGRIATPSDVVGPVVFLLSPAASYINGAVLSVNGGLHF